MDKKSRIVRVLKVLINTQQAGIPMTWIREIAKQAKLHPETVRRVVDGYLGNAVDEIDAGPLIEKGFKIRPIALKPGITVKSHLRYLRVMGKL